MLPIINEFKNPINNAIIKENYNLDDEINMSEEINKKLQKIEDDNSVIKTEIALLNRDNKWIALIITIFITIGIATTNSLKDANNSKFESLNDSLNTKFEMINQKLDSQEKINKANIGEAVSKEFLNQKKKP